MFVKVPIKGMAVYKWLIIKKHIKDFHNFNEQESLALYNVYVLKVLLATNENAKKNLCRLFSDKFHKF